MRALFASSDAEPHIFCEIFAHPDRNEPEIDPPWASKVGSRKRWFGVSV
jgi:hypothetical protein